MRTRKLKKKKSDEQLSLSASIIIRGITRDGAGCGEGAGRVTLARRPAAAPRTPASAILTPCKERAKYRLSKFELGTLALTFGGFVCVGDSLVGSSGTCLHASPACLVLFLILIQRLAEVR